MLIVLGVEALRKHQDNYSTALAIIVITILCALLLLIPLIRFIYRKKTTLIETSVWSELFEGAKKEKFMKSMYMLVFILRRVLIATIIIIRNDVNFWGKIVCIALI